jgi:8-oxo-dGTP pyrophosphatase MutT (NUDIX family)
MAVAVVVIFKFTTTTSNHQTIKPLSHTEPSMQLNNAIVTGPVRSAATVIMLRDGGGGLEVFLLKRHGLSDVLGGAFVFPGGKVDAADARLDMSAHLDQPLSALHTALNEADIDALTAASLYVAAVREVFEESGILFAQDATSEHAEHATRLMREGQAFDEVLTHMQLRLNTRSLAPWSRWITPVKPSVMSKRFDTRFFVAAVPTGQVATHDNHEATESVWLQPRVALEQHRDGLIELAPPQIMSLVHLSRHANAQSVLAEAIGRKPPVVQPEPFDQDGVRTICYPGDPRHSIAEPAFPGPSRLMFKDKRFEPELGLAALLD